MIICHQQQWISFRRYCCINLILKFWLVASNIKIINFILKFWLAASIIKSPKETMNKWGIHYLTKIKLKSIETVPEKRIAPPTAKAICLTSPPTNMNITPPRSIIHSPDINLIKIQRMYLALLQSCSIQLKYWGCLLTSADSMYVGFFQYC